MVRGTERSLVGLIALATAAIGCGATTTQDYCPTVDATGGSVVGSWATTSSTPFCVAPYVRVSSGDWCSQLFYGPDPGNISNVQLGHPELPFKTGSITFTDANGGNTDAQSGNYTSLLHFEGTDSMWFPRQCMDAYGHVPAPTCDDLTSALGAYLADDGAAIQSFRALNVYQFNMQYPSYPPGLAPRAIYTTMDCSADPRGGCDCPYTVGLDVPDKGQWGIDGAGTLTIFSGTSAPAYPNNYGSSGGTLAISGHGGYDLLGQPGLRMIQFAKK
jgi:hypothetical protein